MRGRLFQVIAVVLFVLAVVLVLTPYVGRRGAPMSETSTTLLDTTPIRVDTVSIRARMQDIEQRLESEGDSFTGRLSYRHTDDAAAMRDGISFLPVLVQTESLPSPTLSVACWYVGTQWLFMTDAYVLVGSQRFHDSWLQSQKGYRDGLVTEEAYFEPSRALEQAIVTAPPETAVRVRFDGTQGRREFELTTDERRIWSDYLFYYEHYEFR